MLCATLLRSFRGQHSEKMKGSARGNWDLREGQQPFRPNPNGVGDRTTRLRRLLIGEDRSWSFSQFVSEVATLHQSIFFSICSYLSSIHEKANCIAIFWTGRPHSFGSCHFRGVWATCLPHKGGGVPLSA